MDTYASLYTQTRRTNSTFQRHSPHELESLRLTAPRRGNSTHIRKEFRELLDEFSLRCNQISRSSEFYV